MIYSDITLRSMKKKKGWIEPEKPVTVKPKQEIKKIVADTNELFNVFERRNKGESISKSITDKDGSRTDEVTSLFQVHVSTFILTFSAVFSLTVDVSFEF